MLTLEVRSWVCQVTALGLVFSKLLINGLNSKVAELEDDIKLFYLTKQVKTKADCGELQKDLSRLGEWATKWQMWFSIVK